MKVGAFNRVKVQIGFCGIWCGSCIVGNGVLRELMMRYDELTRAYGLESWTSGDFDFSEFQKGFVSIQEMQLCEGCHMGGGRDSCGIRECALGRFEDCIECGMPVDCKNLDVLNKMREGAIEAGLMVKEENISHDELIERWTSELGNRWPSCIIFHEKSQ